MKKRLMMIVIIILVILFIPRYNQDGHSIKKTQGKPSHQKKGADEVDEFELPLTGVFSIMLGVPFNKSARQDALTNSLEKSVYKHPKRMPVLPVCGYIHST